MNSAESTMLNKKPAIIYVKEISSINGRNGRTKAEVAYATQCIGVNIGGTLYGLQQSISDLLADDEVLIVSTNHCQRCTHASQYADFEGYAFETEPDQLPVECYQLKISLLDEVSVEIQDALFEALDNYQSRLVSA